MDRPVPGRSLGLFRVLCVAAAVWTIGAGIIHFLAVGDHRAHPLIAAFFVVTALFQIGWAVAVLLRPSRWLLFAGIAGNVALIGLWAVTRTTGLPFVPGAEQPEPAGFRDVVAILLEGLSAGVAGLAVVLPAAVSAFAIPSARRFIAATAVAAMLVVAPATLADGGHGHGNDLAHNEAHAAGQAHPHGDSTGHAHDEEGHDPDTRDNAGHDAEHGAHDNSPGHQRDGAQHASSTDDHADHTAQPDGSHEHDGSAGDEHDGSHGDHEQHGDHARQESFPEPELWGQRTTMRIGPFHLPPADLGGTAHVNRVGIVPQRPCQDCYVTAIVPKLVYADGRNADLDTGPMLHHLVVSDNGREDPTCSRWNGVGLAGHRIFAAGNERTAFSLPRGFGFRATNSSWSYIAELMNMSDSARTVYFDADVYYVPASTKGIKPVTPVWLDVANCGFSEYSVPSGRSTERWSWQSSLTGRVVAAGGHVHSGGVGIVLRNGTTRRRMCTSEAAYGTRGAFRGEVTQMSTCIWDRIGTVRRGERLEIASIYDTPKPLDGVMGILMLAVYETDDLTGGTPAPKWMTRDPDTKPTESEHDH